MEIREIDIPQLDILVLPVHNWSQSPPLALPIYPPITSQVGIPIIDMPGCVQSHRDSDENVQLTQEDEDGIVTLCDSGIPTFNPIQYDASRLQMITEEKSREVPPVNHLNLQKHQIHLLQRHQRFLRHQYKKSHAPLRHRN